MNIFRFMIPKSLVETIRMDSTVRQAMEKMSFHRYTALPVLDADGKYVGTLQKDDIMNYLLLTKDGNRVRTERDRVKDILPEKQNKPLYQTSSMQDLFEEVKEHNSVPVVDDRGCFIGMILRREVLNYLLRFYKEGDEEDSLSEGK